MSKCIKRLSEPSSRIIYYGMVTESIKYKGIATVEVRDIKKDKIVSVDIIEEDEVKQKIIYIRPRIKVILSSGKKSFVGESNCHIDDKFNTQIGYEIAFNRAKIKQLEYELSKLIKK